MVSKFAGYVSDPSRERAGLIRSPGVCERNRHAPHVGAGTPCPPHPPCLASSRPHLECTLYTFCTAQRQIRVCDISSTPILVSSLDTRLDIVARKDQC